MDRTELSEKELRRHEVLSRVERRELTLREAAEWMEVSYAQAKRLRRRHKAGGAAGLRHGNGSPGRTGRGRKSCGSGRGVPGAGSPPRGNPE